LRSACHRMLGTRLRGVRVPQKRLSSRFARVRVRPAHRDYWLAESRPEEWLLIECPAAEQAPTKYWFVNASGEHWLPSVSSISSSCAGALSATTNELKQEVGLGHFEGAKRRGFHHHATCALRLRIFGSPSEKRFPPQKQPPPSCSRKLQFPKLIDRGDPPLRPERHVPNSIATVRKKIERGSRVHTISMPLLHQANLTSKSVKIMTQ